MIPFDRRPTEEAPLEKGGPGASSALDRAPTGTVAPSRQGTLPPPVLTAGTGPSRTTVAPRPLPRRTGSRAAEAWMRARVREGLQGERSGDAGARRARRARAVARLPRPRSRRGRAARGGRPAARRRHRTAPRDGGVAREPRAVGPRGGRAQAHRVDVRRRIAGSVVRPRPHGRTEGAGGRGGGRRSRVRLGGLDRRERRAPGGALRRLVRLARGRRLRGRRRGGLCRGGASLFGRRTRRGRARRSLARVLGRPDQRHRGRGARAGPRGAAPACGGERARARAESAHLATRAPRRRASGILPAAGAPGHGGAVGRASARQ